MPSENPARRNDKATTVFPAASFPGRRLTDEEVLRAVREKWKLALKLGGKLYKERISLDKKYGLVFDGNCGSDHIQTMPEKVSLRDLLVL